MGGPPHVPDGAFGNPRHRLMVPRNKMEDDVSPKSVIADIRFISPASSSSSSMDHRPLSEAHHTKTVHPPHHDRGYSISDGESSDPDTLLESSRELNKVCVTSGSLETLPETHSLAATESNICKGEGRTSNGTLLPTIEDHKYQLQYSKRSHQMMIMSNGDASAQHMIMSISSAGSPSNTQSGVSSQDTPVQNGRHEENRTTSTVRSYPQLRITNPFENPGTPLRFFPGWQSQLGSHISLGSPGFDKGIGSSSPANLTDHLSRGRIPFLSGPLHSGIISPRPTPSKWDDAEKWIVSPGHHAESSAQPQLQRAQQLFQTGRRHSISGNCHRINFGSGSPDFSTRNYAEEKPLSPTIEHMAETLNRSASQRKRSKALSFGDLSKRVFDMSCSNASQKTNCVPRLDGDAAAIEKSFKNTGEQRCHGAESNEVQEQESHGHEIELYTGCSEHMDMENLKHALTESAKEIGSPQVQCPCPADVHSWRFEKRKLSSSESQQNSACTTPTLSASPARHNTPAARSGSFAKAGLLELQAWHLAKLELRKLSSDDRTMAAWSTREEEDMECSVSLRDHDSGVLETDDKAAARGEAEQTKLHNDRCDRDEARINAWEELQTSKAEAAMQKMEMRLEKMRARAREKMTNRVERARKKAKEMRDGERVLGPVSKRPFQWCFKA